MYKTNLHNVTKTYTRARDAHVPSVIKYIAE